MQSNSIFSLIEKIAATSSKKEKEALLKQGLAELGDDLRYALAMTYSPLVTYGVRNLPERCCATATDTAEFGSSTLDLLRDLSTRALAGQAAFDAIQTEFNRLSLESAELLKRIILKDMRAGFSDSTMNKVEKGWVPEFPYMRCSLPKHVKLPEWDWAGGIISQEKADGMFFNIDHVSAAEIYFKSRQGTPAPAGCFPTIEAELAENFVAGYQRHGEMLVERDGQILPREEGNGIINSVMQGGSFAPNERPILKLWDEVSLNAIEPKGRYTLDYQSRLAAIIAQIKRMPEGSSVGLIETRIVHSIAEAYAHYAELLKRGKEGTIIKKRSMIWFDGTSKDQVKLKLAVPFELRVKGFVEGDPHSKNAGRTGSLACETEDGLLRVDVAIRGEKMRDDVDANKDSWLDAIITIEANGVMHPKKAGDLHSAFLPVFLERRFDKSTANTLAEVFEQFDNAIKSIADMGVEDEAQAA